MHEAQALNGLSTPTILIASLIWLGLLFAAGALGERWRGPLSRIWPLVFSLSLAVYCTAWTFYGTTTQAALFGWPIPPTFLGTILLFTLGFPLLARMAQLSKQANSTSIADFVASRFGKSSMVAAVVTGVAVLGIIPYISLQLKAVTMSFAALANTGAAAEPGLWADSAFYVAVFMALFAMLFGTRSASATEHNRGLVAAMGFESLFKLTAMLTLGAFVVFALFDGPIDLVERTAHPPFAAGDNFLVLMLLGALAMFTLPHQFHIGLIECRDPAHLRAARWLFPAFLILIALPILPLSWAGAALLAEDQVPADLYVLMLPLIDGRGGLALFAFLGGLSAATGMVILSSLTLSIMIGNHWLTPMLLRRGASSRGWMMSVRLQRRLGIALIMALAYIYHRSIGLAEALADLGALSFSGLAQLGPAVLLAVYRPGLPPRAVVAGLVSGMVVWAYVLVLPLVLSDTNWIHTGPLGMSWLSPHSFLGLGDLDALARGVLVSLLINLGTVAWLARRAPIAPTVDDPVGGLERPVMQTLAQRFLPASRAKQLLAAEQDESALELALEHELAAVVGAASARLLLEAARRRTAAPLDTVAQLVGEAAAQARFSHSVLSGALENMSQGVCVIDSAMRLVAWNTAYLELFNYPANLIRVGRPVEALLRHNAERGLMGEGDLDAKIQRRLAFKRSGSTHLVERAWPDGRIIEIRGNPIQGGGFVATFTDVTDSRKTAEALRQINETLEQRVAARTSELEAAKLDAERANEAKTRFLAAVSHDLVQPLNAAQLLTHSVRGRLGEHAAQSSLQQISGALSATEQLLESLLDISRLESGGLQPRLTRFPLSELFDQLYGEFRLLAAERQLVLRQIPTSVWVESDPQLLRRILQNFLSNAVRYTQHGRIVIGVRRHGDTVLAGVWDSGPGIAPEDQVSIFEEFRRLEADQRTPGLGLGLAIAERMARLLNHPLRLSSQRGGPTLFGVSVPRVAAGRHLKTEEQPMRLRRSGRILIVDNDSAMSASLQQLTADWGFEVIAVRTGHDAQRHCRAQLPDLLILDYHLDDGDTGIDVYGRLGTEAVPAIIISADHSETLRQQAYQAGCDFLPKPIRPLALRSLINGLLR